MYPNLRVKETGLGLTQSAPKLDSLEAVLSQIFLQELTEPEDREFVMKDIMDLISEPSVK